MKPSLDCSAAPLLVVTFYPTITAEEVRAHFRELNAAAEALGNVGVLVDLSNPPKFSPSLGLVAADAMRSVLGQNGDKLVGVAHVTGSAAGRALLAAVQWLAPPPFPTLVTTSRADAKEWICTRLGRSRPPARRQSVQRDARSVAGLARAVLTTAHGLGTVLSDGELDDLGISPLQLAQLDGSVSHAALIALLELLVIRSGEAHCGLRVGADVDAATFGVVGISARASATLNDALACLARHSRLIDENSELALSADPRGLRVRLGPPAPLEWPRQYAELWMAALLSLCRAWTGQHFTPDAVGFRHLPPPAVGEHARFFGCAPVFAAAENFMVIPEALLGCKLSGADAVQSRYFDARLEELAQARAVAPGALADVTTATRALLSVGPTIATVGARLGVSPRTLQRRLNERGITFGDILDSVRREAALVAINRPGASVQEIAVSSGFVDVKAFRRAFVRWTGRSPSEFRKAPH